MPRPAKHPNARKRTAAQMAIDDLQIEQWLVECKTEREIVGLVAQNRPYQLSKTQIHDDIHRLKRKWQTATADIIAEIKKRDLLALDKLSSKAWDQFERSCQDAIVETSKIKGGSGETKSSGKSIEKGSRKEGQCGDPQYLRVILDVQKRRAELLGLNAPAKTELTGAEGGPVQVASNPVVIYLPEQKPIDPDNPC